MPVNTQELIKEHEKLQQQLEEKLQEVEKYKTSALDKTLEQHLYDVIDKLKAENEKQQDTIDRLCDGLKPFAQFACSLEGECDCHNCTARDLLKKIND